jgi:hypothetical protein
MKTMPGSAGTLLLLLQMQMQEPNFSYVKASDPDLTTDLGVSSTNGNDFTSTRFRNLQATGQGVATQDFAKTQNIPVLSGLGSTTVVFRFGPSSRLIPTHIL